MSRYIVDPAKIDITPTSYAHVISIQTTSSKTYYPYSYVTC